MCEGIAVFGRRRRERGKERQKETEREREIDKQTVRERGKECVLIHIEFFKVEYLVLSDLVWW